jgi:hypothetical protein
MLATSGPFQVMLPRKEDGLHRKASRIPRYRSVFGQPAPLWIACLVCDPQTEFSTLGLHAVIEVGIEIPDISLGADQSCREIHRQSRYSSRVASFIGLRVPSCFHSTIRGSGTGYQISACTFGLYPQLSAVWPSGKAMHRCEPSHNRHRRGGSCSD